MIVVLQANFRRKKSLEKDYVLSKKIYKRKKFVNMNRYFSVYVNIHKLVTDIQKNVRRYLAQNKWEPTQKYSVNEDDVSTDYSDIESDSEQEQEQIEPKQEKQKKMDPRLKNIGQLLTKFLKKYNPEKLPNVPIVVANIYKINKTYESIQESLLKKYNANLNDI